LSSTPKIIAITGAESTGKSTLTEALSKHYNVPFEPEFARDYILELHRPYSYEDVEFIAKNQVERYQLLKNTGNHIVLLDTWLLITKIWFREVFNRIPAWIEQEIGRSKIDLFLVCDTDLPWKADAVRENGGAKREKLQILYLEEIRNHGFPYAIISGIGEERVENARRAINRLIK
jgi:nicotinamide riboside kinase